MTRVEKIAEKIYVAFMNSMEYEEDLTYWNSLFDELGTAIHTKRKPKKRKKK